MKLAGIPFLVALLASPLVGQLQQGTVCVLPNSSESPTTVSPGGAYNAATLAIRIDKGETTIWPHKRSMEIGGLDLKERHLMILFSDGKRIQSLWFRFSDSDSLCVAFDGYQGVQLYDPKTWHRCAHKCK
jgi:hypothetical protein